MFKLFVFLTLAALAASEVLPTPHDFINGIHDLENGNFVEINNEPGKENLIVGGTTATTGQWRHMCSLRSSANAHFCGGSIINNRSILSAAHCTVGRSNANTVCVVGVVSRTVGGTRLTTTQIINHPNYNANTIANDVSIVRTSNIATTATVGPIAIHTGTITTGTGTAMGWGLTSSPGSLAANLLWVQMPIVTNAACANNVGGNGNLIFGSSLCAGGQTGRGVCSGDSGGPILLNNGIAGVVSWGIPCARGFFDVFARVPSFATWIQNNA